MNSRCYTKRFSRSFLVGQAVSEKKLHDFTRIYSTGARADNTDGFTTLIIHSKFQPFVLKSL